MTAAKNKHASGPASHKSQRLKLGVAGALGMVLLVVLARPGAEEQTEADAPETTTTALVVPTPPGATRTTPGQPNSGVVPTVRLPEVDLSRILAYNPFAGRAIVGAANEAVATTVESDSLRDESTATMPQGATSGHATVARTASNALADSATDEVTKLPSVYAIVTGGGRPAALVDGQLCHEDDLIDGRWQIVAIHPERVVVQPVRVPDSAGSAP